MIIAQGQITVIDIADGEDAALASPSPPSDKNKLWLDTSIIPNILKQWNGRTWEAITEKVSEEVKTLSDKQTTLELTTSAIQGRISSAETEITKTKTDLGVVKSTTEKTKQDLTTLTADLNGFKTVVSGTYSTKQDLSNAKLEVLSTSATDAQQKANQAKVDAINSANANTTNALKSYMTTEKTITAIDQANASLKLSVEQTASLTLNFESNIFNDCLKVLEKKATETTTKRLQDMPIGIDIQTLKNREICISVDVNVSNAAKGEAGAWFTVNYTDGTSKTYKCMFVPNVMYLQYTLANLEGSINQRIYCAHKIDNKAIRSVSMLAIESSCDGVSKIGNPKVEFGNYPTGLEYTQKEQELRLQKTELLLTPTEITAMVNEKIGADGELKTTKVTINRDGLNVYGGGIRIYNNSNNAVFYADNSGNLVLSGRIEYAQIDSANINISQDARIGNILYLGSESQVGYRYISLSGGAIYPSSDASNNVISFKQGYVLINGAQHCQINAGVGTGGSSVHCSGEGILELVAQSRIYANKPIEYGSDIRLKNSIKEVDTSWIDELHVQEFLYNSGGGHQIGLIAQEYVDKRYSKYFLSRDLNGYYAISYGNITNALVKYCQELKKDLRNSMIEIATLKSKIDGRRNND